MNKKELSERDICTKFITPAVKAAGWNVMEQIREEVSFTAGPIRVRGNMAVRDRKKIKRADYILYYRPNRPIDIAASGLFYDVSTLQIVSISASWAVT